MDKKESGNPTIQKFAAGIMLTCLIAFGVTGCGSQPVSTNQTQTQSAQGQQETGQSGQGNPGRAQMNPAERAAMQVIQLERNKDQALTSDQAAKVKPVLQELIATTNPTTDFLQKEADTITGVFTDQQKSSLTQRPKENNQNNSNNGNNGNNGNSSAANPQNKNNSSSTPNNADSSTQSPRNNGSGNQDSGNRPQFSAQNIYQQALDALNKQ